METKLEDLQKSQREVCPRIRHREVLGSKQPLAEEPVFRHRIKANSVLIACKVEADKMHPATTSKT